MTRPIEDQIAVHESAAERYQDEINRLVLRYGTGVRPGWVGEDIAIAEYHRNRHRAEAERLRNGEAA